MYAIAAQAALVAGAAVTSALAAVWALAAADLAVGLLGALITRRLELSAWIDHEHLDDFEAVLAWNHPE